METDPSVFSSIKQHVKLYVPNVPRFHLVKTDELPEDYELEPLPLANETMVTESSFRLDLPRDVSSPALSTQSRSSSPSLNGSITPEPSSLEKGTKEFVIMTHFIDPTEFYIERASTQRILNELEDNIAKYMENNPAKPEEIIMNLLYVVHNPVKQKWCRGRVIGVINVSPVTYRVLFIDYGYEQSGLTLDAIRCAQQHFNIQPGLAVQCRLAEIAPIDSTDWDQDTILKFKEMISNSYKLAIQVIDVKESVRTVELISFNNNNTEGVSLRNWLIDVKLAKPTTYYKLKRMNPLSASQFFYDELPLDKYTHVEISFIESPSAIYVKKVQQEKDYQQKIKEFYDYFSKVERQQDLTIKTPEYGNAVAVKGRKVWLRGMITEICHEELTANVFLVDIGSTLKASYSELRRLSTHFTKWNAQVIKVSLADIKPIDDIKWSQEVIDFLKNNLHGHTVKIIPFSKTEDTYDVCMYFTSRKININALLVSENYVQSTGLRSKHTVLDKDISVSKRSRKKAMKNAKALKEITPAFQMSKHVQTRPVEEIDPYKVRVHIHKIISPDTIYVSDCSNRDDYQKMMAEMQKFYLSKKGNIKGSLDPDWIYCVYSRKDKQFCRASLIEKCDSDPSIVKMALVDLGEIEEIPLDEIQPLESRFIDTPKYQFKIRLAGIEPCGGSKIWPSSSCQKLKDIINDTGDSKYYITLIEDSGPKDPMPVELFIKRNIAAGPTEPNKKEVRSVARCLFDFGLALPIRGYNPKNEKKELAIELKKQLQFSFSNHESSKQISDSNKTLIEEESIIEDSDDDNVQKVNGIENDKLKDVSSDCFSLPPKVTDWIEPAHIKDTTFDADITFVDYEGNVHFHPDTKEYKETLQYISDTLFTHYDKKSIKEYDYNWEIGDLCIASFHADKKWYRGRIMEVINHQTVLVLFVDYGNVEEASVGSLKKRIILEHIPIQCTKARIAGIKPVSGKWKESDLDILHAAIVSKPCQIKIVNRPPKAWKVAVWVKESENSTFYALPWYLKNKTTMSSIEVDNESLECQNLNDFQENGKPLPKIEKLIIHVNSEDSSENSSNNEDSDSSISGNVSSEESEIQDDFSNTVRENVTSRSDITLLMNHCNSSTAFDDSQRKLKNSLVINTEDVRFNEDIDEKVVSGNSIYLNMNGNDDFETESVRSEALSQCAKQENFVASTPLNISFQDIDLENTFGPIDFYLYGINLLEIVITTVHTDTSFSGYITHTAHEELNQWIMECQVLQQEIYDLAENQPIHDIKAGKNCIAKYKDGLWYRARILKNVATEFGMALLVQFVDFGNRMYIRDDVSIRTAKDEWLQIPMMGIRFKLHNAKLTKTKEFKDLQKAVTNILRQKSQFTALIKKHDPMLELELYWDNNCQESAFTQLFETGILEMGD